MSALSDEIGYGSIIDQYFDAYNRKQLLLASPVSESGYLAQVESELTGSIPLQKVYDYDKTVSDITQYGHNEITELDATLDTLKISILEYLNANSGITEIYSPDRLQAIVPVDSENFDVVTWP